MRKLLGGVVALGVATAGSFASAGPGAAQAVPDYELNLLTAALEPTAVTTGEQVTVTSIDACSASEGYLSWAVFEADDFSWDDLYNSDAEPVLAGDAELAADGSWEAVFDFSGPVVEEDAAAFGSQAVDEEDPGEDPGDEPSLVIDAYGPLGFTLDEQALEFFAICVDFSLPDQLLAELTPEQVMPGDTVTVRSIDPCPDVEALSLTWDVWLLTDETEEFVDAGEVGVAEDGSWEFTLTAPDTPGFYAVFAQCASGEEWVAFYEGLIFEVGEAGEPPAEPPVRPDGPRPAEPVVGKPGFTG